MKTKEFKGIISRNTAKDNSLILNVIGCSCIPFNSWFETHSRLMNTERSMIIPIIVDLFSFNYVFSYSYIAIFLIDLNPERS